MRQSLRRHVRLLALLAACLLLAAAAPNPKPVLTHFETPAPVWSLAALSDGLALGELPSKVVVADRQGKALKEFDVGGLPLALAAGRMIKDGPEVILVAAQDQAGQLWCLANTEQGLKPLWRFAGDTPSLSVALGDIDGDGKAEVALGTYNALYLLDASGKQIWRAGLEEASSVTALAIGDLTGDRSAEVVAGTFHSGVFCYSAQGKRLWHLKTRIPDLKQSRPTIFSVRSVQVVDLNADGHNEVVIGSRPNGMVMVLRGDGATLWRRNFPRAVNQWSTAVVEVADLTGDGKPELACLLNGIIVKEDKKGTSPLMVLDAKGNLLAESYPDLNIVCLGSEAGAKGRRSLILGSPTRGRGIWAVDYAGGVGPIELPRPKDDLDALAEAVAKMPSRKLPGSEAAIKPVHVLVPLPFKEVQAKAPALGRYLKTLEGPGLRLELLLTEVYEAGGKQKDKFLHHDEVDAAQGLSSREEIIAAARFLEAQGLPFFVTADKNRRPCLAPTTCEAILKAAPGSCRGFLGNEDAFTRPHQFDRWVAWVQQVVAACHAHGDKKYIMDEYLNFWADVPTDPAYFQALFRPEWRSVVVPMYKTNRLVAPEQNLGMVLGLWKAGVVDEWGYCTEDDLWKWESVFLNPPHDVLLRMEVMSGVLGATYYRIEANREFIDLKNPAFGIEAGARRHRDLYHSLIRKGVLRPAQSAEEVLVSPVVLRKAEPSLALGQWFSLRNFSQEVLKTRGLWAYNPQLRAVPPDDPFGYLYRMRYGYDGLFPQTPYGPVCLLPADPKLQVPGATAYWTLKGERAKGPDGQVRSGQAAGLALLKGFEGAATGLPATAEGCLTLIRKQSGGYQVWLLDPGQLDARGCEVSLKLTRPQEVAQVTDGLSGQKLAIEAGKVPVKIGAGTFRVLEVKLKQP